MTASTGRYHHGDLPNALRRATAELIAERGLGSFSLREVARRAGVSHNAPSHHFGDTTGLLTSLAIEGFRRLTEAMNDATVGIEDPAERLVELGRAYVRVGMEYPAHCQVMFRSDLVHDDEPELIEAGHEAYTALCDAVRALVDAEGIAVDVDEAARLCWCTGQGVITLHSTFVHLDALAGRPSATQDELAARFTAAIVAGLRTLRDPR